MATLLVLAVIGILVIVIMSALLSSDSKSDKPIHTARKDYGQANVYEDGRVTMDFKPNVAVGGYKKQANIRIETSVDKIQAGAKRHEAEKKRLLAKYGSGDIIDIGGGMVRVKHDYLRSRYIKGAIISDDLLFADADDAGYVTLKRSELDDMEARLKDYNAKHP